MGWRNEIIRWMLDHGASPGQEGEHTLMHVAAFWGNMEIIRLLIDSGMNPNSHNKQKESPTDIAKKERQLEAFAFLAHHGGK